MASHNEDKHHHENHPCGVKIEKPCSLRGKIVNQLDALFRQANSLAHCNSFDKKECKEAADSSDLRQFSYCIS